MAEITWSLMHPTPLDIDYMKKVVANVADYHVDSFEICADCHSNLGGMDGLTDYAGYPVTHASIDLPGITANREKLRSILKLAHSVGKPVYYWHREAMVPAGLLEDRPGLLDSNGEFDLLGSEYAALLRYKIDSSFKAVPELDGLVLTLTEASYSVIHSSSPDKYPPAKVVEHIVRIFASELAARGKHFVLRSFGSIAQDYEDIISGAEAAAKDYGFEIETKITPYDFDPFLPVNPFLRSVPGATLGAECDCLGEFLGAGMLPAENVENIVRYVRAGQAAGVSRYAIRLDRIGNNIFDCYQINLYAYERAISDPGATAESIRREWLEKHAPASARKAFHQLGIEGFKLVGKNNFIDGNVIFHQFPSQPTMKYLKAAFIFALFKNGVDLHNGSGVWSILSGNPTPGREAIIREKEEAVEIARRGVALLASLPREKGFEEEYEWRERCWNNALIVTQTYLAFVKCICAYFDDMEAGFADAPGLHKAAAEAEELIRGLAGKPMPEVDIKDDFVNGLELNLFHVGSDPYQVYLVPLYFICRLIVREYDMEFAARQRFAAGKVDCILCGSLCDEWRIARYMHSAHVAIKDGYQFRIVGNTVFPNGFADMELLRNPAGGMLEFFGDISENDRFSCIVDGGRVQVLSFDAEGYCAIPLAPGGNTVKVRLQKAPGVFYPRFRAVAVRA